MQVEFSMGTMEVMDLVEEVGAVDLLDIAVFVENWLTDL
jgi:hypothetical protein